MRDCSVTGCGLTVVEPDLVLVRVTGDSRTPDLPPAMGESDMVGGLTGGVDMKYFLEEIVS